MGRDSKISWTDHSFNPWWGCMRVSPGCAHCYAATFAKRCGFSWDAAPRRFFGNKYWNEPLKWNKDAEASGKSARVFCASMADLFEDHPDCNHERPKVWKLIEKTPWLTWLLCTKRPENMIRMAPVEWGKEWPRNIWALTTVENQDQACRRVPELLRVPARVRGLSCEPMLGPLELRISEWGECFHSGYSGRDNDARHNECSCHLDWIICGGESGAGARPFQLAWARALRDQCANAGIPFFMKQLGTKPFDGDFRVTRKGKADDPQEWPADLRIQQFPG